MSNRTRKAIMDTFVTLLDERSSGRITVREVAERCGVNRNTFYYHFQDLPSVAEAIATENVQRILENTDTPRSVEACLDNLIAFALEHRNAALHLYRSTPRVDFEHSQWRVCRHVAAAYLGEAAREKRIPETDARYLRETLSCMLFGLSMNWLEQGMKPEWREDAQRVCRLLQGEMDRMLTRCASE